MVPHLVRHWCTSSLVLLLHGALMEEYTRVWSELQEFYAEGDLMSTPRASLLSGVSFATTWTQLQLRGPQVPHRYRVAVT